MIPGAFDYHRPSSAADAARLMRDLGEDARLLAGGHSLIPMMKLRMAAPAHLIDLQDITELKGVARDGDCLAIGAMVTQHELLASPLVAELAPLLHEAALQIADPQVRYLGTVGGNVANGDPGNDMPGLMQCLNADFDLAGPAGTRKVAAREFYHGAFDTARAEDEVLTRILVPAAPRGQGYAYEKLKRKIGDYATAAAAVTLTVDAGRCSAASIAMTNLADRPIWSAEAGAALVGTDLGAAAVDAAVAAMQAAIEPGKDNRGPVEFKHHAAGVMLRRALARAMLRAQAGGRA